MPRILFLLFLALSAYAHASMPDELFDPEMVLDSIVTPGEQKVVYAFDQWGNITLHEIYSWSLEPGCWVGVMKLRLEFDSRGNNILYESFNWDPLANGWVGSSKSESEYDGNNLLTHAVLYQPGASPGEWTPWLSNYFGYDDEGNRTYLEYNSWSEDLSAWVPESKHIFAFNSSNRAILSEEWLWNRALSSWDGVLKVENEYSGVLNIMLSKQYGWDPSGRDWVLTAQTRGEWNEGRTAWTLTEYAIDGDNEEPLRSIIYYFKQGPSGAAPVLDDGLFDPFAGPQASPAGHLGARVFDLSGKMVPPGSIEALPKGLYIMNGKKVMK